MKAEVSFKSIYHILKDKSFPFLKENGKIISQFVFTIFFIGIGFWFLRHEQTELSQVKNVMLTSRLPWIIAGIGITVLLFILHGFMYKSSFATIKSNVHLNDTIVLFLKRNFISVFLPAGGISSLAFFAGPIEKKGVKESEIYFASVIYGFVGILSVVIVAVPAFIYALTRGQVNSGEWIALASVILILAGIYLMYRSVSKKGIIYKWLTHFIPQASVFIEDLENNKINKRQFLITVLYSVLIEIAGISHLYVAMIALNFTPSVFTAVMGYIVSVIFLIISPFLRGLGAIEVSMSYCLMRFGFNDVDAISITLLYRFFEFWIPLFIGALSFLVKLSKLMMRIVPALLMFFLGIINIVSVFTPAIAGRLNWLKHVIPVDAIYTSNYLVLIAGLFLLVTAAFMLKGLRAAWWFALILSIISFIGNLTKAVDYEEATAALVVISILIATRKEYYIKNNPQLRLIGLRTSIISVAIIILYGVIGFYFIDKKHFNIDFSFIQSVKYTLQNYFMIGSSDLTPADQFAKHFLFSIKASGFLSISFLVYTFIQPYIVKNNIEDTDITTARDILKKNGTSALDYFKTYFDKQIFLLPGKEVFIAYRISGNFAVALENPVAENPDEMENCILAFDNFCYQIGLKSVYYRVPESSLEIYKSLGKKSLLLGQTGIVDISSFTLEGGSRKSMRNAVNKVRERGIKTIVYTPPVKDGILQKIKSVSDDWLQQTGRKEIVFSQGMFNWDEMKNQTIIAAEDTEEKIVAFSNIIPDYVKGEATYDLIRKTKDAPGGIMDFIIIELISYLKSNNYSFLNLGLAPMSGIDEPQNFPEKSMKYAYEKIKSFSHFKGLRDFKEKFSPRWINEYLIFSHDYDLLQIPTALSKVIKP